MEPSAGLRGQVEALQRSVGLLAGLLAPCLLLLALLLLLAASLWLRRRQPPPPPPRRAPAGPPQGGGGRRHAARPRPAFASPALLWGRRGAAPPSGAWRRPHLLVPPNSPATIPGAAGTPEGAFPGSLASTEKRLCSGSRSASAPHLCSLPFEYGSSIRPREAPGGQQSAGHITASLGPGLDSHFGASAGVSVRILSSDSEGSPGTPHLCGQQPGRFEWDYYDPNCGRKAPLHHQLPHSCSKQYWL